MQNELLSQNKSRPVYTPVALNERSSYHLFICQEGPVAEMSRLYESCFAGAKALVTVSLNAVDIDQTLRKELSSVPLNTTVYLSGTEPFIWRTAKKLKAKGVVAEQIKMIKPDSNERNVFCVHCSTISYGATASPAICSGCERLLLVTDHFSKLHSAYMGYQVNAEDPADKPETEELS